MDNDKIQLSVLFSEVITFHLSYYSEINVKSTIIRASMISEWLTLHLKINIMEILNRKCKNSK